MNANELMIGDWVSWTHDSETRNSRVSSLHKKAIFLDEIVSNFKEWEVYPIPLTAEILEKNGFVLRGKSYILQWKGAEIRWRRTDGYISITAPTNLKLGALCSIANGYLLYVHILQHALRLCELNDLADNFKV